jgi:CheY-like chemotaxis protein
MNGESTTILIVDDNPTNLKLVSALLGYEGHRIVTATNGEDAERIVKQSPPVLILMDIALPGIDGLTLTQKLKADPNTRDICIVALTASAMKGDEQKAFAAGCDGYLTKPIDTRTFPAQIAGYLARAKECKKGPDESPHC